LLRSSLNNDLLFAEDKVALATANLKGQLQMNPKALQKLQGPVYSQGKNNNKLLRQVDICKIYVYMFIGVMYV